jgi:ABC-type Na+ efflux pump permease subunit
VAGYILAGFFAAMFLWGVYGLLTRKPLRTVFWRAVLTVEVVLVLEAIAGASLYLSGRRGVELHYIYALALLAIVGGAHALASGMKRERDAQKVMTAAALAALLLAFRAITTGEGA